MDLEKLQQILDDLETMDKLPLPVVEETVAKSLGGKCSSGMPRPPRVGGISTPEEFQKIFDGIAFCKLNEYPLGVLVVLAVGGIKFPTSGDGRKRLGALVSSIIELNQIYDDLYTEKKRHLVHIENQEDNGLVVKYPDGTISKDKLIIEFVKNIETLKIMPYDVDKMIDFLGTIGYSKHERYHFIPILLSQNFTQAITKNRFADIHTLNLYNIKPYEINPNESGVDIKYEKLKQRWYFHIISGGYTQNGLFDINEFVQNTSFLFGYMALLHLPEFLHILNTEQKIRTFGKHLFTVYLASATKNGFIRSEDTALRYFSDNKDIEKLFLYFFDKEKTQMNVFKHYNTYVPTDAIHKVSEDIYAFIRGLEYEEPEDENITETGDIFSFDFDRLVMIDIRDRMLILSRAIGVKEGRVWVNIGNDDNGFNRVYNLINTIKSKSRLELIEYDVGACQQTILMNVVNDWESYPLHLKLLRDKVDFRNKIGQILHCDYDEAKVHITAISNGRKLTYYKKAVEQEKLKEFHEEAQRLATAFVEIVKTNYADVYEGAEKLAKEAKKNQQISVNGKKYYGHLFHMYAYFERQIREAMKSCFTQPTYDVHDAVYSREVLDPQILVDAVLEQTGFKVLIERGELP